MHWYFKHSSDEEREHAMKLLKYLNQRGGRIILQDIKNPETPCEYTAAEAMEKALELEKNVNEVTNIIESLLITIFTEYPIF
jgi:ferritin heavy chain